MPKIICTDIDGKTYEVDVNQLTWRPSAYGIIFKGNTVLLSPQFDDGMYDLPGGGIELGELPEQGLIREVKEETGFIVDRPKLIACESDYFKFRHENDVYYQTIMLYYTCRFVGGEASADGFEEREKDYMRLPEWVPIKELAGIKIANSKDFRPHIMKAYKSI